LVRIGTGKTSEKRGLDDAENCHVGSDAKSQRQNRNGSKALIVCENPQAIAKVTPPVSMDFSLSYTTPKAILIKRESASPGCNAIHSGDASARGPNLAAAYMTKVQLTNGSYARMDDAFLRDSILNPTMHTTAGYAPIMLTYPGQISKKGLIDLVEYIKQLNSNYRIQQTLNTSQVQSQMQRAVQTSTSAPAQHTAATAPGMVKP
jgi:hypothetical protein